MWKPRAPKNLMLTTIGYLCGIVQRENLLQTIRFRQIKRVEKSGVNRPGTPPKVGQPAWNEARRTASPYIAPNPPLGNRWAILARSEAMSTRPERIRHRQRQCCALLSNLRKSAIDHGARKGSNVSRFHAIILRSAMARCRPRTTSTHASSWLLQMYQENVSDDIPT